MVQDATKIVKIAQEEGIILRILGAVAIRIHCPNHVDLHKALKRELSDIDFAGYNKQRDLIERFFSQKLGYTALKAALTPGLFVNRCIFLNESRSRHHVDVFLDRLEMNHVINFKERLEVDFPTIPLAELLLEKMQIVKINEKDIKDTIVLLLEHEIGDSDGETINSKYIAKLLSKDWGFYYTVTTNLNKVRSFLDRYEVLTSEQKSNASDKIDKLLEAVEKEPKSLGWKLRAKVGPAKKWYTEVEEVERAEHLREPGKGVKGS